MLHPLAPVWDEHSRILILGSFPSVKSRETGFYYGHPQNRFWPLLSSLLSSPLPASIDEKISLLKENGIALWDVVGSCTVTGSADSSIRDARPNDLPRLVGACPLRAVFLNGKTAERIFRAAFPDGVGGLPAVSLPSTSPANASFSLEKLRESWSVILPYLRKNSL